MPPAVITAEEAAAVMANADLLREAIMAAAEDGSLPPTPPTPETPAHEAAVLFAAGYDAEVIAEMNPDERAAEIAEALAQGGEPIDEAEATRLMSEMAAPEVGVSSQTPAPPAGTPTPPKGAAPLPARTPCAGRGRGRRAGRAGVAIPPESPQPRRA